MSVKVFSEDVKEQAYELWKAERNIKKVADELRIARRTVNRWYLVGNWARRLLSEQPNSPKTVVDTAMKMMESIQKLASRLHSEIEEMTVEKGTAQIKALADSYVKLNELVAKGGSGSPLNGKKVEQPDPERPANFKIKDWEIPKAQTMTKTDDSYS